MLTEIKITVVAGNGGDGVVSFRREKFVPRGGPVGGAGGRGGDVIVQVNLSMRVLDSLRRRKTVRAVVGGRGGPAKKRGRTGKATVVGVPAGTQVWRIGEDDELLADLVIEGQAVVVVEGGAGGRGNATFATSMRRTPRIAERGLPGEKAMIKLELRLLAEVGLVGLPNAGKSSLLRQVSQARPKVGAYPFTTLEPYLGMVEIGYETLVVADIPGLIEGAHEGAGLGIEFLQNIRRTRVLVCMIDGSAVEPRRDLSVLRRELDAFGRGLVEKRWVVALNKVDLPEVRTRSAEIRRELEATHADVYEISALTGEGMDRLLARVMVLVKEERNKEEAAITKPAAVLRPKATKRFAIVRRRGVVEVRGHAATEIVQKMGVASEEARVEVARRLARLGVSAVLQRAGVQPGDRIRVGGEEFEWPG